MERQVLLDAFEAVVAGLPRLRWEAFALIDEIAGREPEYLRTWVRVACPTCQADLTLSPSDEGATLTCGACGLRSHYPG
jgi:hypothetical protein